MTNQHRLQLDGKVVFTVIAVVIVTATVILIRLIGLNVVSDDFFTFTKHWVHFIAQYGAAAALRYDFSNYAPPYLYLLSVAHMLFPDVTALHLVKLISIPFDFLCALGVYLNVRAFTQNRVAHAVCISAVLLCPTVVLNSAYWGQADAIYTSLLLLSLWLLVSRRTTFAMLFYSLAFAFKLQAIFLLPLYIYLTFEGNINWRLWLFLPTTLLLAAIPVVMTGRPVLDALSIYVGQIGIKEQLTNNAPSIFQWLPHEPIVTLGLAGLGLAALFVVALWLWQILRHQPSSDHILHIAMALAIGIPFLLPRMHDRYFYVADVLSIVLAIKDRRMRFAPFLIVGASLSAYIDYFAQTEVIPLSLAACLNLIAWLNTLWALKMRMGETVKTGHEAPAIPAKYFRVATAVLFATVVALAVASAYGNGARERLDAASTAAVFRLNNGEVTLHSPTAARCADGIHIQYIWSGPAGLADLKPITIFVHGLDADHRTIAQTDGKVDRRFPLNALDRAYAEQLTLATDNAQSIRYIEIGLYFADTMQRFQAFRYDGSEISGNSYIYPVGVDPCA